MSITIKKQTSYNKVNYCPNRNIKYIVIHYTAGSTSRAGSAVNTANFWATSPYEGSADFAVDDATIVQYNPDLNNYLCWHCGDGYNGGTGGGKYYGVCTNANSIGIEICSNNDDYSANDQWNSPKWYFTDAEVTNAVELTKYLMAKYNVDAAHVIRHYDVSGKVCPGVLGWNTYNGSNENKWLDFKKRIGSTTSTTNTTTSSKTSTTTATNKQTATTNSTTIKAGSVVKIAGNATYYDGKAIPSWVKAKTWIVKSISGDRVVIDKSKDGQNSIMSAINKKYISLATAAATSTTTTNKFTEYKVRVTASVLNIRKGAGTNYTITGTITDKGVYTIVGEATGTGATKWLKLKSGAGYIASDYTKKV